jgi:hypothetical protein
MGAKYAGVGGEANVDVSVLATVDQRRTRNTHCSYVGAKMHVCVLMYVLQGVGLRFEAEATGWLQNKSIPMTSDAAKYEDQDVTAKVLAILTPGGLL